MKKKEQLTLAGGPGCFVIVFLSVAGDERLAIFKRDGDVGSRTK